MVKINIVCVGSIKENFFADAIKEYSKRLSRFCSLNIVEVNEFSNEKAIQKKIDLESQSLIKHLKGFVVLLDREGELVSSEDLAKIIDNATNSAGEISFVIGGSNGVNETLKRQAGKVISFGKITFPHQLFRVVLLEQIYRGFNILSNTPYHK